MGLTVKGIAKLTRTPGRYAGRYRDQESRGLYLQVSLSGTTSWLLRYEINHRERFMGLGAYPDFSLMEARERARRARQLLADGIDPIEAREADRRARAEQERKDAAIPSFEEAAARYFKVHGDKWKAKHAGQFVSTLEQYAFPRLGKLRVNAITTSDVLAAIEPIWRRIPETASRVRGRIESVLSFCIANKYATGPNAGRWSDNLEHLLPAPSLVAKVRHHAALPYDALPAFFTDLNKREGISPRALEFTILTASRTGEAIGATWDEIDTTAKTWTVPAGRIKGGKEHRVPLSDRAIEILRALPRERGNHFVFIGPSKGSGLSSMAMGAVLKRMGRDNVTVHGFRSCFRDWAAETTSYPSDVVETALAHTVGSAVQRAYRRGDLFEKRRKLMAEWARYATTPTKAAGSNVVAIRMRKAR